MPLRHDWPSEHQIHYYTFDQGNKNDLDSFFGASNANLIIDDGSHIPKHQSLSLLSAVEHLSNKEQGNGIFILEDIHTSHPNYSGFKFAGNALTVLLGIQHYRNIDAWFGLEQARLVSASSHFTPEEVLFIDSKILEIHLYRRTKLPKKCYRCGSTTYCFSSLKCTCGVDLFLDADSMSFVLIV